MQVATPYHTRPPSTESGAAARSSESSRAPPDEQQLGPEMQLITASAPMPGPESALQLAPQEEPERDPVWLFVTEAKAANAKFPSILPDDNPVAATLLVTPTHLELTSAPASNGAQEPPVCDSKVRDATVTVIELFRPDHNYVQHVERRTPQDLRRAVLGKSAWRAKLTLVDIVQQSRSPPHGPQPYPRGDIPGVELGILCAVRSHDRNSRTRRHSIRMTLRLRTAATPRSRVSTAQNKQAAEWARKLITDLKVECDYSTAAAAVEDDDANYLQRILAGMCLDEIDNVDRRVLGELGHLRSAAWMDAEGRTLLHLASQWGHINCVRCLVDVNIVGTAFAAVFLNVTDYHEETALHLACKGTDYTHLEVAEHLLRAGVEHRVQNENGKTAFDLIGVDVAGFSMKKILEPIIHTSTARVLRDVADDGGGSLLDTIRNVLDTTDVQPRVVLEFLYRGGCSCVLALLCRDDNPCIQVQAAQVAGDLLSILEKHASWPYDALTERMCQPGGVRIALVHRLVGHLASSAGAVQRAAAATLARDARTVHHPSVGNDLRDKISSSQLKTLSLQLALLAMLHKELGRKSEPVLRESDLVRQDVLQPSYTTLSQSQISHCKTFTELLRASGSKGKQYRQENHASNSPSGCIHLA